MSKIYSTILSIKNKEKKKKKKKKAPGPNGISTEFFLKHFSILRSINNISLILFIIL